VAVGQDAVPRRREPRKGHKYREFRRKVLARYGPVCYLGEHCRLGDPAIDLALEWDARKPPPGYYTVHHVVPLAAGGALLDLDTARPAHLLCNESQGARPAAATIRTQARWR
jgi:hypothetical protein